MMRTIPYEQALLIKRTAWMNMQPRKPRPEDARLVPIAVRMLTYVACLNYAVCDLETELAEAGMMRHRVKRTFGMVREIVQRTHQQAWEMIARISAAAARQYNDELDAAWKRIDDCVALLPPERAYNIVAALCRLIENLNAKLAGRYDFAPARALYRIPALLECTAIHDYRIDAIIELNIR